MNRKKVNISKSISGRFDRSQVFNKFDFDDFAVFQKKFCGMFIYRGKRAYSVKAYDFFLKKLKERIKRNPMFIFYVIAKNLVPFFLLTQKRYGKRVVFLPIIAKANRKNRFMLNWLVRQVRNRSNICGVKLDDVLTLLIETYFNRGSAVNLKKEFYRYALANKFNLRRSRQARKAIWKWQKTMYKKLQEEEENAMLLNFMTEEQLKRWKEKRDRHRTVYFFWKPFKRMNYRKYLVK